MVKNYTRKIHCVRFPAQNITFHLYKTLMKTVISPDSYEKASWQKKMFVCGIDEVGRGCLAGPVVVAAAILPQNTSVTFTDSKKLSATARNKAFEWLQRNAWYTVAHADHSFINTHNIYQATLFAMRKACLQMVSRHPAHWAQLEYITVDAMPLKLPASLPQQPAIIHAPKGEDWSSSIAAASIIAKVTRDSLMQRMTDLFPSYRFGSDKAYASPKHCATLRTQPATFIHRTQFITTVRTPKEERHERQRRIC